MKKIIWVFLVVCQISFSQKVKDSTVEKDLKVGLVLSGGGAKGFAHIGALKIIEESGVRIDYIGGTSMGAIIGALYASGYTANQLDSLVRVLNFKTLLKDELPRKDKTFYEKTDTEKYAITLPFDNFKINVPSGVSKGQNLYNLFSKLTSHVNNEDDFTKFPIPFFCIATNLETGAQKKLDKGYLPKAIMASGAIPTIISPVKINDTLYVDGGVVNNYPVDEVRAMGADIVIGIDVQDSLKTKNQLKSAFDIFMQINNFRSIASMKKKRKKTDIYLHPNIANFNMISFDDKISILEVGKESAQKLKDTLVKIAKLQGIRPKINKVNAKDSLFVNKIDIKGNKYYTRSYVLGKLQMKAGEIISYEKLSQGVNNLSATGNFQNIDYRLEHIKDNKYNLIFNIEENNSKNLLRIGVHFDDLYKTSALLNVTRKRVLTNNDVASLDFIVGDNIRYNFDYYIDKGYYWSVGMHSGYTFFDKNVPTDILISDGLDPQNTEVKEVSLKYGDLTNQIYFETLFKRKFLLRLGGEHKWLSYYSNTLVTQDNNDSNKTIFVDNNFFSAFGKLKFDTLDKIYFPDEGFYFEGDFNLYLIDSDKTTNFKQYSIAKANMLYAKSFKRGWTITGNVEGGVTIGGDANHQLDFLVGGYGYKQINNLKPFYGYEALSLRGDTYLMSRLTIDCEVFEKSHLNISANIANVGDDLFNSTHWIDRIDYTGYALGCGWETFLGPIEIIYSYSPEAKQSEWYVTAGFIF
jgi:NTE family protein